MILRYGLRRRKNWAELVLVTCMDTQLAFVTQGAVTVLHPLASEAELSSTQAALFVQLNDRTCPSAVN